jgi:hypothetical protein
MRDESSGLVLAVYEALERRSVDGFACCPVRELAQVTGAGEKDVCQALRALCQAGDLEPAGRQGKSTVFRLPRQLPGASAAEAVAGRTPYRGLSQSTDLPSAGGQTDTLAQPEGWPGAAASVESDAPDQCAPVVEEDTRQLGLQHMDNWLAEHEHSDELGPPHRDAGLCMDCEQPAQRRWVLGSFVLCRSCRLKRHQVGLKAIPVTEEPGPEVLVDVLMTKTSSNGHDPDWLDLPNPDY